MNRFIFSIAERGVQTPFVSVADKSNVGLPFRLLNETRHSSGRRGDRSTVIGVEQIGNEEQQVADFEADQPPFGSKFSLLKFLTTYQELLGNGYPEQ